MAMVLGSPQLGGYNRNLTMHELNNSPTGQMTETDSRLTATNHRPISALARGVQITEFAESQINPTPLLMDESDLLIEQYLSPGKLQMLTGVDDLQMVPSLELKVDARETSLGNFGSLLPNLTELKLSGSYIQNVRDLGSSFHRLRVLWLTRCGLEELDGISSMLSLNELYLEYNEISDLSPISMLEELQILDLEGNNIEDITQVQYLSLCPKLKRLALDGNPICVAPNPEEDEPDYDYRQAVQRYLPNLQVLDDEGVGEEVSDSVQHNVFDQDWAFLEDLQEDALLKDHFTDMTGETDTAAGPAVGEDRLLTAALRPATGYRPGSTLRPSSGFRSSHSRRSSSGGKLGTAARPPSASNRPVSSDAVEGLEATSELTMGAVICGNPSKALRQRKDAGPGSKAEVQKGLSKLLQKGAVFSHSETPEDIPFKPEEEMNSIIEELQSWKVEHERRMKEIAKTKEAQVLVVDHDEAEDVMSDSDAEDFSNIDMLREEEEEEAIGHQYRHTADLRLKSDSTVGPAGEVIRSKITHKDLPQPVSSSSSSSSSKPKYYSTPEPRPSTPKIRSTSKYAILRGSVESFDQKDRGDAEDFVTADQFGMLSSSYQRPVDCRRQSSTSGSNREEADTSPDLDLSPRPLSRGQHSGSAAEGLAPLRAPSPTPSQLVNMARAAQPLQSPPSPKATRKLRVGPTGLPLSSSQQPVIRNALGSASSRSSSSQGLVPSMANPTAASSRGKMALLPSQPRIPRHLPEPPSLLPHPPPKH